MAHSQQQALMQKHAVTMLTDFSGHDPIQTIYKLQLVYYLHRVNFLPAR